MKTVLITGASSGIGKEAAKLFYEQGWQVVATMRHPEKEQELKADERLRLVSCDVTNQESIQQAVKEGMQAFGQIDVLVNNAGYYLFGPVETAGYEQIKQQIDTNLLGLIMVSKAVIPHFRQRNTGVIINVSSITGRMALPLQSLYHASKWGVEGFSEGLQFELRKFQIQVKLIEPGIIKTDFYSRSMAVSHDERVTAYDTYAAQVLSNVERNGTLGSKPSLVAETIYRAATDHKKKLRYSVGKYKQIMRLHTLLPQRAYRFLVQKIMEH